LTGRFGFDDFWLGVGEDAVKIKNQTIGLIQDEQVLDSDYDAIIGLAYPKMADHGLPIFDSIMKEGLLTHNMFSFYMAMNERD
jgi:hypothetical protein